MATNMKTRSTAATLANVGNDNADLNPVLGKPGQLKPLQENGKRGTIVQRTRDALGDIGNRLTKKNPVAGKPLGGIMKPIAKPSSNILRATENITVPAARVPKVISSRPDVIKKPVLPRSTTVTVPGQNTVKAPSNKSDPVKGKGLAVSTSLNRPTNTFKNPAVTVRPKIKLSNENKTAIPALANSTAKTEENKKKSDSAKLVGPTTVKDVPTSSTTTTVKEEEIPTDKLVELSEVKPENEFHNEIIKIDLTEEEKATPSSSSKFEILDIDLIDDKNPLLLRDYILDICNYLFRLEKQYPINIRYLEGRLVNSRMRSVLLDWLVEVHHQFGFMPETLYIAAKTLDRYLQKERKVCRKQLQLVGVTAMYIAAKYEEVCTPTVLDFSAVSDNAFTVAEVRGMEREILSSLEFDLAPPPAVFFLRRFSKAAGAPMMVHTLAKYIMELTLVDYSTCHLYPSEQAAAALALSLLIMNKEKSLRDQWTSTLEHYSRISYEALKRIISPVVSIVAKIHEEPPKLKAVFNKYGRNRLSKVSLIPELKVEEWKNRVIKDIC